MDGRMDGWTGGLVVRDFGSENRAKRKPVCRKAPTMCSKQPPSTSAHLQPQPTKCFQDRPGALKAPPSQEEGVEVHEAREHQTLGWGGVGVRVGVGVSWRELHTTTCCSHRKPQPQPPPVLLM